MTRAHVRSQERPIREVRIRFLALAFLGSWVSEPVVSPLSLVFLKRRASKYIFQASLFPEALMFHFLTLLLFVVEHRDSSSR